MTKLGGDPETMILASNWGSGNALTVVRAVGDWDEVEEMANDHLANHLNTASPRTYVRDSAGTWWDASSGVRAYAGPRDLDAVLQQEARND